MSPWSLAEYCILVWVGWVQRLQITYITCRQKAWVSATAAQTLTTYDRSAMLRKSRLQAARQVLRN